MQLIGYTTSHSLHAKVLYAEGVLVLRLSGLMTGKAFQEIATYAAMRGATYPWTVVVYDMLKAVSVLDVDRDVNTGSALTRIGRPGCFLTTDDRVAQSRRICEKLGMLGIERRAFTSSDPAYGWAQVRALQIAARSVRARARALEARAEEAAAQLAQVVQERLP
jgi:hypothetical protein